MIQLVGDDYRCLGIAQEVSRQSEQTKILEALDQGQGMTVDEIAQKKGLRKTAVRRGLKGLAEGGQITRTGRGSRGNPYLYRRCYRVDADASPGVATDSPSSDTVDDTM